MYTEIIHSNIINIPARISCASSEALKKRSIHPAGSIISSLHLHEELEMLIAVYDGFGIKLNNRTYVLDSGDAILIKSRVPHETFAVKEGCYCNMLQFAPEALQNDKALITGKYLSRFINSTEPYIFRSGDPITTEALSYVSAITDELKSSGKAYDMYIKANLYMLLACFYRHGILNNAEAVFEHMELKKIMPVLTYVNEHFEEPITLENAANMLKFNPEYFCRLFKKATGMTFIDYLNFVRISQAENSLLFSDKSIGEISLECGFSSISYFNRVFKKFKLISPSDYRRSKYAHK